MATDSSASDRNDDCDEESIESMNSDGSSNDHALDSIFDDDTSVESSFTTIDEENEFKSNESVSQSFAETNDSNQGSVYFDADETDNTASSSKDNGMLLTSLRDDLFGDSELEVHHGLGVFCVSKFKRPINASHQALRLRKMRREIEETDFLLAPERREKFDFAMRW
ncbi:hypothetical protein LTR95_009805 [Oleoguttula sp. CCFEE 5521]